MDAELQLLQGTWRAVRAATAAGPVAAEVARQLRYRFAGDRVTLFEGDRATGSGTVTVHPTAVPKGIDVAMTDGPGAGQVARGVYEVAGDRLLLCIGPERPAGFCAAGLASVVELERVADTEPGATAERASD
jgi:uncharacterized protein (TIGR03067 family)